jgi:hypothetical protein
MTETYEPASNFLTWVLAGDAPLSGSDQAESNLNRVIALTEDYDATNRDWATFILGHDERDTPAIRNALLARVDDPEERIRAEAIVGLARRDKMLALPFVRRALAAESAMVNIFEAAAIVADASLIDALREYAEAAPADWDGGTITDALHACETGVPDPMYV